MYVCYYMLELALLAIALFFFLLLFCKKYLFLYCCFLAWHIQFSLSTFIIVIKKERAYFGLKNIYKLS